MANVVFGPPAARLPINSTNTRLTVTTSSATSPYTLTLDDSNTAISFTGTLTVLVPDNSSVAFPVGTQIIVINRGSGTIDFDAANAAVIRSAGGLYDITDQYGIATLLKTGADEWYLAGKLA